MNKLTKTNTKVNPSILQAEWITPEAFYAQGAARNGDSPSYGNGTNGAHEWRTRSAKWHRRGLSDIAKAYSREADMEREGDGDCADELLFL